MLPRDPSSLPRKGKTCLKTSAAADGRRDEAIRLLSQLAISPWSDYRIAQAMGMHRGTVRRILDRLRLNVAKLTARQIKQFEAQYAKTFELDPEARAEALAWFAVQRRKAR